MACLSSPILAYDSAGRFSKYCESGTLLHCQCSIHDLYSTHRRVAHGDCADCFCIDDPDRDRSPAIPRKLIGTVSSKTSLFTADCLCLPHCCDPDLWHILCECPASLYLLSVLGP